MFGKKVWIAFQNVTVIVWLSSAGVAGIVYSTAGMDKSIIDGLLVEDFIGRSLSDNTAGR